MMSGNMKVSVVSNWYADARLHKEAALFNGEDFQKLAETSEYSP